MDDNNVQNLAFGLHWKVRTSVDEQDKAVFSWGQTGPTDSALISQAVEACLENGWSISVDDQSQTVELSTALAPFIHQLLSIEPNLLNMTADDRASRVLQVTFQALEFAKVIVQRGDVLATAFLTSFSVHRCLQVLRDTAESSDDVMPAWGSGNGQFRAFWVPAWSIPELAAIRRSLISEWCKAFEIEAMDDAWVEATNSLDWLLLQFVDHYVRKTSYGVKDTTESSGQSYRVMYRGEADVFEAWRQALLGRKPEPFQADGWLVARSMRQALAQSGWLREALDCYSGEHFYTLAFRLVPPVQGATSADWQLDYEVINKFFHWSKPLSTWWEEKARLWHIGLDTLVEPETWILPKLREAAQVCSQIKTSLQQPNPDCCVISADDVYPFLTESLPKLRELGFLLEAPNVVSESGSRVRVRVRVKRAKGEGKGGQSTPGAQWFDADRLVEFDWSVVVDDEEISRETFSELVASQTPFVQVNGSWRLVPIDDILRQIEQFAGDGKQLSTRVLDLSRAILMSSSTADVPVQVDYQEEALPVEQIVNVLVEAANPPLVDAPAGLRGSLRHYQQFGYSWLLHLRSIRCGACLADDMGLGKTVQVLAYLLQLQSQQKTNRPHLLVCPTSLLPNWRAELARFAPSIRVYIHHGTDRDLDLHLSKNVDLIMTTYATLVRDIDAFTNVEFDALIVDEAQNIKNVDTKQAQAIRQIQSGHRIALTGTPMENRLEELWSLMDFLNPGYMGTLSWFRRTLADPTTRNPNSNAASKLQVLLRPVLLRRRKSDPDIQTELPDKWEVNEHAYLTSEQAAMYQALVDQLFTDIQPKQDGGITRRGQILATLVRLKQVCDHPALISGGTAFARRSGKLRQLVELLKTVMDEGEGALIFTQFRDMGEILCDTIERELKVRPKFLHGGLSASARGQMVDDFQSGKDASPILVLSLRAGGVGLNLTRANHVFHFDRWWNPAVEDQATDRAYRIGQTKDVQVHKMICTGTLEERIDDLITSKRELSQAIVSGSNDWVTELDDAALRELFTLGDQSVWEEDDI